MHKLHTFLFFLWLASVNSEPSRRHHPHYIFWKQNPIFPLDNLWTKLIPSSPEINPYYISPHIPQEPPNYFNIYSHFPESSQSEKEDTAVTTNEDILIDSLNSALVKLNQLLPPEMTTTVGTSSGEEYTNYKHTVHPEILAQSLNKAIDTLTEVLSKVPKKHPPSVENLIVNPVDPILPTSMEEQVFDASDLYQQMTYSVESAIQKLDELFKELPEELKNNPAPDHNIQNADQTLKNIITGSNVQLVQLPSESSGVQPYSNSVSASTESSLSLFTSKIQEFLSKITTTKTIEEATKNSTDASTVQEGKEETKESIPATTPTPAIKTAEEEFTSAVITTDPSVTEDYLSTTATVLVSESTNEIPITTSKPAEEVVTYSSPIDVRIGLRTNIDSDAIFFPDDEDEKVPDKLAASNIHDISIPSRFGETASSSTTAKPLNLQYQPTAPNPYPALPEQNPLLVVSNNAEDYLGNRFGDTTTTSNNTISLEYKPMRPFFAGPVTYPQAIIPPGTQWPASSTARYPANELADRFQQTTTTPPPRTTQKPQQNTPISLEYKPMRPFFAGPVMYPEPIIPPGTPWPASSTETSTIHDLVDRFQQQTTITTRKPHANTPISLEYKPSRPFYAPNPIVYPSPIIPSGTPWPASSSERYQQTASNNDLGNRFQSTTTPPKQNTNTPIVLEYKPTRSPFLPDPWVYPSPIIPSGTPWPASSTERL